MIVVYLNRSLSIYYLRTTFCQCWRDKNVHQSRDISFDFDTWSLLVQCRERDTVDKTTILRKLHTPSIVYVTLGFSRRSDFSGATTCQALMGSIALIGQLGGSHRYLG